MPGTFDWRYFFLPEDSSAAERLQPVAAIARIGKTLLWTGLAVLFGLLIGHPF
ncbi:MAG: hypothetical protein AB7D39_08235 [Pseudodesulfovibrio sp.]|uniref:hypothetical protein n=1 Tax=Pseudodesulfovibrio sp. TaxID=2035812 RepID=UPI003D10D1FC